MRPSGKNPTHAWIQNGLSLSVWGSLWVFESWLEQASFVEGLSRNSYPNHFSSQERNLHHFWGKKNATGRQGREISVISPHRRRVVREKAEKKIEAGSTENRKGGGSSIRRDE